MLNESGNSVAGKCLETIKYSNHCQPHLPLVTILHTILIINCSMIITPETLSVKERSKMVSVRLLSFVKLRDAGRLGLQVCSQLGLRKLSSMNSRPRSDFRELQGSPFPDSHLIVSL